MNSPTLVGWWVDDYITKRKERDGPRAAALFLWQPQKPLRPTWSPAVSSLEVNLESARIPGIPPALEHSKQQSSPLQHRETGHRTATAKPEGLAEKLR